MANPYTGSAITGCSSPAVGADKSTYTAKIDTLAQAIDEHDHTTGKGNPIGTSALVDLCVTADKLDADAVETDKIKDANVTLAKLAAEILSTFLPPGIVVPFASAGAAPTGYLLCDGSSLLRASYPALFTAIGTIHGTADADHFNLPDYRGRFLRGRDASQARDPNAGTRTAANTGGATGDNVGSIQAADTASHTHGVNDPGHTHLSGVSCSQIGAGGGGNIKTSFSNLEATSASATGISIAATGGSETRPINAYVAYLIKT